MLWRHRILFSAPGLLFLFLPQRRIITFTRRRGRDSLFRHVRPRARSPLRSFHTMRSPKEASTEAALVRAITFEICFCAFLFFCNVSAKNIANRSARMRPSSQGTWGGGVLGQARRCPSSTNRPQGQRRERLSAFFAFVARCSREAHAHRCYCLHGCMPVVSPNIEEWRASALATGPYIFASFALRSALRCV